MLGSKYCHCNEGSLFTVLQDTSAKTVKFAYKNYNYDPDIHSSDVNKEVDQDGDLILYGTCSYLDLPLDLNNDIDLK